MKGVWQYLLKGSKYTNLQTGSSTAGFLSKIVDKLGHKHSVTKMVSTAMFVKLKKGKQLQVQKEGLVK